MEHLLIKILNMSLTGAIVIAAVVVLRFILRRAPRIFSYMLWSVVLFRLLCPFSFPSAVSLLDILRAPAAKQGQMNYIPDDIAMMEQPMVVLPYMGADHSLSELLPPAAPENSVNPMQIVLAAGSFIWLAGVLVMAACSLVSYWRLRKRLKGAIREKDNIYKLKDMDTPFVCGIFSPKIYLPSALEGREEEYILLHEQIHVRRGDPLWRVLGYLALCLHWFNPLVWLAFLLSGRDMEMSCDEAVLRTLGNEMKKEYSASLLSLACGRRIVPGMPMAFGEGETGGRIRNVLRYKKPASVVVGIVALFCTYMILILAANPRGTAAETEKGAASEVYYGIVCEKEIVGTLRKVVTIPGLGDVEIPEAEEVYPYIEIESFSGPEAGDLIEITFPAGERVTVQETWPAVFSGRAQSVVVMGQGFLLDGGENGTYRFTVPWGLAREAGAGDLLSVYYQEEDDWRLLAEVPVLSVDVENYDIWVEFSKQEVSTFLAAFGRGIRCESKAAEGESVREETEIESARGDREETEIESVQEESGTPALSVGQLADGTLLDGDYRVYVAAPPSDSEGIDRYFAMDMEDSTQAPLLAFGEACKFFVNQEMDRLRYGEVPQETFAALMEEELSFLNPPVVLTFEDGLVTQAVLEAYYGSGISYASTPPDTWYEDIQGITGLGAKEVIAAFYSLEHTYRADIGYNAGEEQIMVYTGDIGDGESGMVLLADAEGEVFCALSGHTSRAGWNNIYLGERAGENFILTLQIENRDRYGEYAYQVFRFAPDGTFAQRAGSCFTFYDDVIPYDEKQFEEWCGRLSGYLEDSFLLLSTQEGEIRTEAVSEAQKYNYEALRRY